MSSLAIIKDDRYLEHIAGEGHPESPNRLRVIHDLIAKEFSGLPLIEPRLATEDELCVGPRSLLHPDRGEHRRQGLLPPRR